MAKKITMNDIAQAVHVSTVTVSKALAGRDGVSDAVREEIRQKALEMGYSYTPSSKEGSSALHYNIGILIAERYFAVHAYYNNLYTKIVMGLGKIGYSAMLEILPFEAELRNKVPGFLANGKVDGLIVLGQLRREYVDMMRNEEVPHIFIDFYDDEYATDAIISDGMYGSYLLTNYLIKNGHCGIAFVGSIHATSSILDRYLGYYKAVIEHRLSCEEGWLMEDHDEAGRLVDIKLPARMPTAFVCSCDEVAYRLVNQLKSEGYRVPDDISVVGFDDYIFATLCTPQLTTFRINPEMMAETVVESIQRKIDSPGYSIHRKVISGDLVIRDSVKKMEVADGKD